MGTWKKLAYADDVILKSLLTEQGDIIYASAASTPAALAHGTAGQYLKTGGDAANPSWDTPAGGGATIVRKTADEIVNNSTTLQNDNHLLLVVGATEVWAIFLWLKLVSVSAAPDHKLGWAVPTGGSLRWIVQGLIGELAGATGLIPPIIESATQTTATIAATKEMLIWGLYVGGGTAGTLQFQWAQNAATVEDTTIQANSFMIAHKVG